MINHIISIILKIFDIIRTIPGKLFFIISYHHIIYMIQYQIKF